MFWCFYWSHCDMSTQTQTVKHVELTWLSYRRCLEKTSSRSGLTKPPLACKTTPAASSLEVDGCARAGRRQQVPLMMQDVFCEAWFSRERGWGGGGRVQVETLPGGAPPGPVAKAGAPHHGDATPRAGARQGNQPGSGSRMHRFRV